MPDFSSPGKQRAHLEKMPRSAFSSDASQASHGLPDTNSTHGPSWYRVIPDSQSDGTPLELATAHNTNQTVLPGTLPSNASPFVPSWGHEAVTSVASHGELPGLSESSPQHGRYCDCPVHIFSDLLSSLSRSLNEIKDEVVRLEVAFDALSAAVRAYRCLAAPGPLPTARFDRHLDAH